MLVRSAKNAPSVFSQGKQQFSFLKSFSGYFSSAFERFKMKYTKPPKKDRQLFLEETFLKHGFVRNSNGNFVHKQSLL